MLREVAGPLTEKQIHYLTRVRSNTQHLAGLINDLLDLSKIESGKIEVKSSRVSLGGLVHEVVEALRPVAAEKVIALEATLRDPSILVWADRDKVNQVLTNLIGNAIKFTPVQAGLGLHCQRQAMAKKAFRCLCPIRVRAYRRTRKKRFLLSFIKSPRRTERILKAQGSVLRSLRLSWSCTAERFGSSLSRVAAAPSVLLFLYQDRRILRRP